MTYKEKLKDIKENPSKHKHTFAGLLYCCGTDKGINGALMEAHELYVKVRENSRCDVIEGPCACGAWH